MKKATILGLTVAALAGAGQALAAPTMDIMGMFRAVGIVGNESMGKNEDPDRLVDQRFRLRLGIGVNEYVKVVYYTEIDFEWGDSAYTASRNDGGGIGGDNINLETKNIYVEAKVPGTPIVATIGLQNNRDPYDMILYWSDDTGVRLSAKSGMVDATVGWFKFWEGTRANGDKGGVAGSAGSFGSARAEDDTDFYLGRVTLTPATGLKVGAEIDYFRNQGSQTPTGARTVALTPMNVEYTPTTTVVGAPVITTTQGINVTRQTTTATSHGLLVNRQDLYYGGVFGNYTIGIFDVQGWFVYGGGTMKTDQTTTVTATTTVTDPLTNVKTSTSNATTTKTSNDVKVAGYVASAKASINVAGVNGYLRGMYYSDAGMGKGETYDKLDRIKSMYNPLAYGPEQTAFLLDTRMPSLMVNDFNVTGTYAGYGGNAIQHAAEQGYGLTGLVVGAKYSPPVTPNFYTGAQLGYYRANNVCGFTGEHEGRSLGTEVAAKVGYKFLNGAFDVSLNGVYAVWGGFYAGTVNRPANTGKHTGAAAIAPDTGGASKYINGVDPDPGYRVTLMVDVPF